jgi:hypothetical protein
MDIETIQYALKLTDPLEFDREFYKLIRLHDITNKQAYQRLEAIYQSVFQRRRYASVDSYRLSRRKRIMRTQN